MNFQTGKIHFQEVNVVAASSCRRRRMRILLESICHCCADYQSTLWKPHFLTAKTQQMLTYFMRPVAICQLVVDSPNTYPHS